MNKTECATKILCAILENNDLSKSLRARFREEYIRTHPEAHEVTQAWRRFVQLLSQDKSVPYADIEERLATFSQANPVAAAQLMVLRAAVEIDGFVDYATGLAEKLIQRTT